MSSDGWLSGGLPTMSDHGLGGCSHPKGLVDRTTQGSLTEDSRCCLCRVGLTPCLRFCAIFFRAVTVCHPVPWPRCLYKRQDRSLLSLASPKVFATKAKRSAGVTCSWVSRSLANSNFTCDHTERCTVGCQSCSKGTRNDNAMGIYTICTTTLQYSQSRARSTPARPSWLCWHPSTPGPRS